MERKAQLEALNGWTWDPFAEKWEEGFRYLNEFLAQEGHCKVLQTYANPDGYRLGSWVNLQRTNKDRLSAERLARLEALPGWSWDPFADQWEEGLRNLEEFFAREGSCKVPQGYTTAGGVRLGGWVHLQRSKRDSLEATLCARLEALSGWTWDPLADQWEEGFRQMEAFARREGNCKVVRSHITTDGYKLGQWINVQRTKGANLPVDRHDRLETLPGWVWNEIEARWEERFRELQAFSEREGHCKVSQRTGDGKRDPLGQWVREQRGNRGRVAMSATRADKLARLPGWHWPVGGDTDD